MKYKVVSLRRNFLWTCAGNFVYAGCQWGVITVLARWGTPEMVGQFSLALAITSPVFMFTMMQLRAVQVTDAKREFTFQQYLSLRSLSTVIAFAVVALFLLSSSYRGKTAMIILSVGVVKAVDSVSDIFYGLMQSHERMDCIAISLMLKGPLALCALTLLIITSKELFYGVLGFSIASPLVLLCYELWVVRRMLGFKRPDAIRPSWDWAAVYKLARISVPLGLVMMLISLNANVPRYFIEHSCGERELGYFSSLAYLQVALNMVVTALGQAASARLARLFAENQIRDFIMLLLKLTLAGVMLAVISFAFATMFGRPFLKLLYGPDYADYQKVFLWLTASSGILCIASFLGYGMTAARAFKIQVIIFFFTVVLTSGLCLLLVPTRGILGASQAILICSFGQLLASAAVVWSAVKKRKISHCE